jgi:hypothetical protein
MKKVSESDPEFVGPPKPRDELLRLQILCRNAERAEEFQKRFKARPVGVIQKAIATEWPQGGEIGREITDSPEFREALQKEYGL